MASTVKYQKKNDNKTYWRAFAFLGYENGKKIMKKKQGFLRQKEAKDWAEAEEEKANKGFIASKYKNMLLKDFIMDWFNDYKKDTLSINAQGNNLSRINTHIIPGLGNYKLDEIETYQIQQFYNDLINAKGLAPDSAKKVMETLNNCFKYAKKNKLIFDMPTEIEKKPLVKAKVEYWTKEEAIYYLNQIRFHYLYLPVLIALNTGLRVAEICGLKWKDLDLNNKILNVTHQVVQDKITRELIYTDVLKTPTSYRRITLPNILNNYLASLKADLRPHDNDFIVLDREGNMCNPRNLSMNFTHNIYKYRYAIEEYKGRNKDYMQLRQISFHSLRHTHASLLILAKEDIKVVSERLGHASVKVTYDTYVHIFQEMKLNTSNLLDDIFS